MKNLLVALFTVMFSFVSYSQTIEVEFIFVHFAISNFISSYENPFHCDSRFYHICFIFTNQTSVTGRVFGL